MLLRSIPKNDTILDELDDWLAVRRRTDTGYHQVVSGLKAGGTTRRQGGWAVHHSTEEWLWARLGPEFAFMEKEKDFVPQFAMPMLEDGKDPSGQPYWVDYEQIHGTPPSYHNGKGLASHLGADRIAFDQSAKTDVDKKRLVENYVLKNRRPPFDKHGKMPEVTRRFLNAVIKKAAKNNTSRSGQLMDWLQQ